MSSISSGVAEAVAAAVCVAHLQAEGPPPVPEPQAQNAELSDSLRSLERSQEDLGQRLGDLQAQHKQDSTELQAQLEESQGLTAELQRENEEGKTELSDLKEQYEKAEQEKQSGGEGGVGLVKLAWCSVDLVSSASVSCSLASSASRSARSATASAVALCRSRCWAALSWSTWPHSAAASPCCRSRSAWCRPTSSCCSERSAGAVLLLHGLQLPRWRGGEGEGEDGALCCCSSPRRLSASRSYLPAVCRHLSRSWVTFARLPWTAATATSRSRSASSRARWRSAWLLDASVSCCSRRPDTSLRSCCT
ncbi:hypothetical protein CRUP_000303 [Coryphaenoides rupestris]|nr:hypothetical protein CRUP_000303 [Coryphaenoides rupestris]